MPALYGTEKNKNDRGLNICPVCGSSMQPQGVLCSKYPECRYDASLDYRIYPSLQPVSSSVITVSALKAEYTAKHRAGQGITQRAEYVTGDRNEPVTGQPVRQTTEDHAEQTDKDRTEQIPKNKDGRGADKFDASDVIILAAAIIFICGCTIFVIAGNKTDTTDYVDDSDIIVNSADSAGSVTDEVQSEPADDNEYGNSNENIEGNGATEIVESYEDNSDYSEAQEAAGIEIVGNNVAITDYGAEPEHVMYYDAPKTGLYCLNGTIEYKKDGSWWVKGYPSLNIYDEDGNNVVTTNSSYVDTFGFYLQEGKRYKFCFLKDKNNSVGAFSGEIKIPEDPMDASGDNNKTVFEIDCRYKIKEYLFTPAASGEYKIGAGLLDEAYLGHNMAIEIYKDGELLSTVADVFHGSIKVWLDAGSVYSVRVGSRDLGDGHYLRLTPANYYWYWTKL